MSTPTSGSGAAPDVAERRDFIREIVAADIAAGRVAIPVTRFPPEPNGYLHIGHAKSICLNFGIAQEFGGRCHLRFDDTNPEKEEQEYIDAIEADVRWLGFDWGEHLYHASDYFEQLYAWAVHLVEHGLAYVDDQTADEIRETRGTLTAPGHELAVPRPGRRGEPRPVRADARRRVPERRPRPAGEDRHGLAEHQPPRPGPVPDRPRRAIPRTGDAWCIYPTYDFAHGQSDAIEGVTHSICTLEFEAHRPLYDWLIEHLPVPSTAPPVRVRPAQPDLHGALEARPAAARQRGPRPGLGRPADADDLRPAPARLPGRGHPRLRRRRSASPRPTASSRSRSLEHAVRDVLNRTAPRRFARPRPAEGRHRELPRGPGRDDGGRQQPRGPVGRDAERAVRARAVDRARRLHGGPAAEVLPARAGPRGPPPVGVLRHLHRRREGRRRAGRRAALHLRPGDARRRRARRPAAQGDAPLAVGRPRGPGRGPPLRPPVRPARPGRRRPRPVRGPQPASETVV